VFSIPEVAERLRISSRAVARLVAAGQLPSVRIGRRRLIAEADLSDFIESRRAKGGRA